MNVYPLVGFEVLTAVSMKVPGIALMMEAARTSETLVNFYQTTRCYNPEDIHLHLFVGSNVIRRTHSQTITQTC
jgi:hypothetical protein